MNSIIDAAIQKQQEFLARYRLAYLAAVGRELGFVTTLDLRDLALREAAEMIELARALNAPPTKK